MVNAITVAYASLPYTRFRVQKMTSESISVHNQISIIHLFICSLPRPMKHYNVTCLLVHRGKYILKLRFHFFVLLHNRSLFIKLVLLFCNHISPKCTHGSRTVNAKSEHYNLSDWSSASRWPMKWRKTESRTYASRSELCPLTEMGGRFQ